MITMQRGKVLVSVPRNDRIELCWQLDPIF